VVCKAGPFAYNSEYWENNQERQRLPLDNTALETGMFQFSSSDIFHAKYREELKVAHNIKVIIHANVVEIVTNESGKTVNSVRIVDLAGKESKVLAKVFILACGGFANARLLLMSNQQQSIGLGNQNDVVGRYYHDHPQAMGGNFIPADRNLFNRTALYDLRQVEGNPVMGFLRLSKKCLEEEKLLNINTCFFPKPGQRQAQAIASFKSLAEAVIRKPGGEDPLSLQSKDLTFKNQKIYKVPTHLLNIMLGLDYVAKAIYLAKTKKQSLVPNLGRGGWSELDDNRHRFRCFETLHLLEQSPDPNNRVILSRERDALGCQKIEVHYRWSQDDAERTARALSVISRELLKTGLGQFKVELDKAGRPKVGRPTGSAHLMGTTRMHDDPKQGVVDSDCRVHDIINLYIAGSSTFPTGGYANPTLTIVAMAIRLADLIKHKLNHSSGY
jgi:choline dehydrogenase-like flavoprotein